MGDVEVTYEGATPAGGLSNAVRIEDKSGKRHTFRQGVPEKVDASVGRLAESLDHHNFKIEPVKADSSSKGDS